MIYYITGLTDQLQGFSIRFIRPLSFHPRFLTHCQWRRSSISLSHNLTGRHTEDKGQGSLHKLQLNSSMIGGVSINKKIN